MSRIAVVTGSASGIGAATKSLLEHRGERVIGVDLHDADIELDLTSSEGRATLAERVSALAGGRIDALYANAGLAVPAPTSVALNYFGALATLNSLRPLLAESESPRAVVTSSLAAVAPVDETLMTLLDQGDEHEAVNRADTLAKDPETFSQVYGSTKKAISQWVRRSAPSAPWAGESIALNAIAPGVVLTPMIAGLSADELASLVESAPSPLNGPATPEQIVPLMAWLGSVENTHVSGQVIYIDGGCEAILRGDSIW